MSLIYLDSSAIVKMVAAEPETRALRAFLSRFPERISSVVSVVEVGRAARRLNASAVAEAAHVLSRIALVPLERAILDAAVSVGHARLRTLDAIHLATALVAGEELASIVTYDHRFAEAAEQLNLSTVAPT